MIEFTTGNILKDDSEAIVNTVNCVGVMGKGLALQFKKAYPHNFVQYKKACDKGEVRLGKIFVTQENSLLDHKWIINFPTKNHWKAKSTLESIEAGLSDLVTFILENNISSIAIPPLGSGLGGLDWQNVKERIIAYLNNLESVAVKVYEPSISPVSTEMPIRTKKPTMTKGRALLIKLLEFYSSKGYECTKLEVQKMAYFLQESGIPLRLNYKAHHFGPYANNLNHVLEAIDGHYISGYGDRVSKSEIKLKDNAIKEADSFLLNDKEALSYLCKVEQLIEGYETPLSMEVLSTVHWVIKHENKSKQDFNLIRDFIYSWNEHKAQMKEQYLKKAFMRLETQGWV
ncbi:MAG: Appr-1-p processing protein [Methylococcaceae bacterium]|nr:Appr-1-p processing protein [Methylococcaceae bacterium]